jgi:hypothetical protein
VELALRLVELMSPEAPVARRPVSSFAKTGPSALRALQQLLCTGPRIHLFDHCHAQKPFTITDENEIARFDVAAISDAAVKKICFLGRIAVASVSAMLAPAIHGQQRP